MSHRDSLTEGREICPKCKVPQDVKLTPIDDITFEQEFSCGFKNRLNVMPPIIEEVGIRDEVEANIIKFRTLTEGPILVSDASGTSVTSGSFQGSLVNGNIIGTVNFNNTYRLEINNSIAIDHLNIQNVLSMVDGNNSYSPEEKEQIKGEISQADKIIKSIGKVSDKALSYIQLLISLIQKSG